MRLKLRIYIILFFGIFTNNSVYCGEEQNPVADPDYYLIDSLDLSKISKNDKLLIDSTLKLYHASSNDTVKLNYISELIEACNDAPIWIQYNEWFHNQIIKKLQELKHSELRDKYLSYLAEILNNKGFYYDNLGNMTESLNYYEQSLHIQTELNNKLGMAASLNNLGLVYVEQGNVEKGLEFQIRGLKLLEAIGDKTGAAYAYNNIGYVFYEQGDTKKAMEYYEASLQLGEEVGNKRGVATSLTNMAMVYQNFGDLECDSTPKVCKKLGLEKALKSHEKCLILRTEINDKNGLIYTFGHIASIFNEQDNHLEAKQYHLRGLKLSEELEYKNGIIFSLKNLGTSYLKLKDVKAATAYAIKSLSLAQELGYPQDIHNAASLLVDIYKEQHDFKKALYMKELAIKMRDSINNQETQKATIMQQTKYEFEKAALIKAQELQETNRLIQSETERRNNLQYSIIFMAILLLFGIILAFGFIPVSPKMAGGIIFFSFLILFEFILVLADPYVDVWTGGAPGYKLLFNAVLAGVIFPVHRICERLLRRRLFRTRQNIKL